ncbi:hypothetical protein [Streptomyces sp. bgisy034]|uniref:hypothetical protein n=1 Tax=Streptomyces sp. bgisy034 TaxID=3413774 RepID=UPI003EBCDC25
MTGVLAYLAVVVALGALTMAHQAQPFPPFVWWRTRRQRSWARGRVRAWLVARATRRGRRGFREAA